MSDAVEITVDNDISSKLSQNLQVQEQEVNDCTEFLKIAYRRYRKYKIILESVKECLEDDSVLDDNLKKKIKNIICSAQLSEIRLNQNAVDSYLANEPVLGVSLTSSELTYSEGSELEKCMKSKLDNKYHTVKNSFSSLLGKTSMNTDQRDSDNLLDVCFGDLELIEFKRKLISEQECYITHQLQLLELLEELKCIRLENVPQFTEKKLAECTLRSKINYLKSLLATEKCKVDIFMETSYSLQAYTELIKDIKGQQEELKEDIRRLNNLKKQYAHVSCMEYDEIHKSYVHYKAALDKKKKMYEYINAKT
ncbi:uncharacterized protein LOC115877816 [Sitophilus oryzae]|uniref:Uncharacterized protein LOC115877816 n=1 Tax=Sitophilus oryzae TaxID=7048 RepID=A0A6J2XH11_SITOR|nr:uncharacterized protein LOC115877816 [Sitophilus oryzae]